ncbi:uncharacterized protein LOC101849212 [Aplysia californica]|uniref:Uncharacterized protein LOC101849212 n=1 Tax=Aplysia californica TaxID=6500 RepID=A0ABM1A0F6_APLCA|nr:uncharacterized protein LOC101849212 [Aplysia californica]
MHFITMCSFEILMLCACSMIQGGVSLQVTETKNSGIQEADGKNSFDDSTRRKPIDRDTLHEDDPYSLNDDISRDKDYDTNTPPNPRHRRSIDRDLLSGNVPAEGNFSSTTNPPLAREVGQSPPTPSLFKEPNRTRKTKAHYARYAQKKKTNTSRDVTLKSELRVSKDLEKEEFTKQMNRPFLFSRPSGNSSASTPIDAVSDMENSSALNTSSGNSTVHQVTESPNRSPDHVKKAFGVGRTIPARAVEENKKSREYESSRRKSSLSGTVKVNKRLSDIQRKEKHASKRGRRQRNKSKSYRHRKKSSSPTPRRRHHNSERGNVRSEMSTTKYNKDAGAYIPGAALTTTTASIPLKLVPTHAHTEESSLDSEVSEDGSASCPNCPKAGVTEDDVRQLRLEMFQDLVMRKLRMTPADLYEDVDESAEQIPLLPDTVLEQTLRDNSWEEPGDDFYAKDQKIVISGKMSQDCISMHATGCYDFRLAGNLRGKVASAQLWVYKTGDRNDANGQTLIMYELERNRRNVLKRRNIIVREDTFLKEDWVTVDLTRVVRRWVERRRPQVKVAIRCKTCITRNPKALYGAKHGYTPLLMITYADNDERYRGKRSTDDEYCNPKTNCCKRPLVARFREINLHNIMYPRNLTVGYCFGSCNAINQFTFNHTMIKQRIRLGGHVDASMRIQLQPCCVPLQLKDALILTHSNGTVTRRLLPRVIVERCGCV